MTIATRFATAIATRGTILEKKAGGNRGRWRRVHHGLVVPDAASMLEFEFRVRE